jgi:hypothetical protein
VFVAKGGGYVLAQAKNGAELFWEEKSYAADGNFVVIYK